MNCREGGCSNLAKVLVSRRLGEDGLSYCLTHWRGVCASMPNELWPIASYVHQHKCGCGKEWKE